MTFKNILISFILLLAIALCGWLFFSANSTQVSTTVDADQIDTAMEDVVATIYDKQGKPSLKIITPKMVHYLKSNTSVITTPNITAFREPDNIWYINANYAEALNDLDKIIFHDNVVVRHRSDPHHPLTTLYTSALTVYPKTQLAETDQAVSILQPSTKINAVGLLANLNDGTIKLLSQAREDYVPEA